MTFGEFRNICDGGLYIRLIGCGYNRNGYPNTKYDWFMRETIPNNDILDNATVTGISQGGKYSIDPTVDIIVHIAP